MDDRQRLILAHGWIVDWAARRRGRSLERQEARQEGMLALVGAAAEWDGQGRFSDFAAPRVAVAIRRMLRRHGRVWRAEWADEHIASRAEDADGVDVDTEAAVRRAMAESLDETERAAIRRHYWGEGGGDARERRLRRRAEAKLRRHLAG